MYIIFSDVDGTMIDHSQSNLLNETKSDIKKAKESEIKFAISTGNGHFINMKDLSNEINADFLVTSDGARIVDLKSNEVIYKKMIAKKEANDFLQANRNLASAVSFVTEERINIDVIDPSFKEKEIEINKKYNDRTGNFNFTNKIEEDIYKMTFIGNAENLKIIAKNAIASGFEYLKLMGHFMTVSAKGANKGDAAIALCKIQNIDIKNAMVIGDGSNDISMFKICENSYAMANATADAKKHAKRHTSSVEQNGLGEAINDFIFRMK